MTPDPTTPAPQVECPNCGYLIPLTADGKVELHSPRFGLPSCASSGKKPEEFTPPLEIKK